MERGSVVTILDALANGVDPTTGERIDASCYQNADVVRALFAATEMLKEPARSRPAKSSRFANTGNSWTDEEDAQLTREHEARMSTAQMALRSPQRLVGPAMIDDRDFAGFEE